MKQSNNNGFTHFESLYPEDSRFEEIQKILDFLKEGNSCQLIGLPGSGKSNLLRMLAYNHKIRVKHLGENQKNVHFVYMNFSEVKNRSLFDVNKYIFLSLADSLRDRELINEHREIHRIFKEHLSLNDELVLFQGLKEAFDCLSIEKKLSIIFLFDRFDEYIPVISSEFFANLRILRNKAKYRFASIFSLTRPLEETLITEILNQFYEFIADKIVYLNIKDKIGLDFRISYLEKVSGKKIKKELIEKLISLTGGHSKLTRLATEIVTSSDFPKENIADFLIERKQIKACLFEIWSFLTPFEQKSMAKKINLEQLNLLEKIGLIKNGKISIPLLEMFLDKNNALIKIASDKIIYDQNTNQVKKGEIVLSDALTTLEFRLLKFLIDSHEKILERNEIISAVWKDTQTTAGVTDQALDQLIFRVRKKIEDDPNNPKHLQTVKGRGLKFTS